MPDMTAIGKIMGGGAPIAAFGGREDVMAVLAPIGGTFTGGTHGGNPFCVGMAHRVLDLLEAHPEYYDQMRGLAAATRRRHSRDLPRARASLRGGATRIDRRFQIPSRGRRIATTTMRSRRIRSSTPTTGTRCSSAAYYCRRSQNEVMFVSTAHSAEDIDETVASIRASFLS